MKCILGKKIEMTHVFTQDGVMHPVTAIKVGPCYVTQVRTQDRDGYNGIQIGFDSKNASQALRGHFKGVGQLKEGKGFRFVKEFKTEGVPPISRGDAIDTSTFEVGDLVTVTGWSKGRGFTGVVKRHGFAGHPSTHGHKDQLRTSGSIGAGGVQRVFKGLRMAGRMGNEQVTIKGAEVLKVDTEQHILYVKGGIPGSRNGYLLLKADGELKVLTNEAPVQETPVSEPVVEDIVSQEPTAEQTSSVEETPVASETVEATPEPATEAVSEPVVEETPTPVVEQAPAADTTEETPSQTPEETPAQ